MTAIEEILALSDKSTDHPETRRALYKCAVESLKDLPACHPVIEFGTLGGGSALALMAAILQTDSKRCLITVDPYLSNPGISPEFERFDDAYRLAMMLLSQVAHQYHLHHIHYKMTAIDYLNTNWNLPHYTGDSAVSRPRFSFVHVDTGHDALERGLIQLMIKRSYVIPNGTVLVDDVLPERDTWLKEEHGGKWISHCECKVEIK